MTTPAKRTPLDPNAELKNGLFEVVFTVSSGRPETLSKDQLTAEMRKRYGPHVTVLNWQPGRTEMRVLLRVGTPSTDAANTNTGRPVARAMFIPLFILTALAIVGLFVIYNIVAQVKEVIKIVEEIAQTPAGTVAAVGSILVPLAVVAVIWFLSSSGKRQQRKDSA